MKIGIPREIKDNEYRVGIVPSGVEEGVIHYCVPNIPGSVPTTSTYALTNVTLPYCRKLAATDPADAVRKDPSLAKGVNTWDGHVTCRAVAEAVGREYTPVEDANRSPKCCFR